MTAPAPQPPTTPTATAVPQATPAPAVASTATPLPTATPAPNVEYLTYGIGEVGAQVVLAYTNGNSLSLYSVSTSSGWVYRAESNGPKTVKLKFFNTENGEDSEWKATIESGQIKIEN